MSKLLNNTKRFVGSNKFFVRNLVEIMAKDYLILIFGKQLNEIYRAW